MAGMQVLAMHLDDRLQRQQSEIMVKRSINDIRWPLRCLAWSVLAFLVLLPTNTRAFSTGMLVSCGALFGCDAGLLLCKVATKGQACALNQQYSLFFYIGPIMLYL